jgi:hypothetical protein
MKKTLKKHFTNWLRSTILIKQAARLLKSLRIFQMHTKSLETKKRNRCMTVQGLIPNNNLPLSHRLIRGSSRASVDSPGVVLATPMEAADSINRITKGRKPSIRLTNNNRGTIDSKMTLAINKKPVIPITGLPTARNTTHTQEVARVLRKNT